MAFRPERCRHHSESFRLLARRALGGDSARRGLGYGSGRAAPGGGSRDCLARHHLAVVVRPVDGAPTDHAVRHPLRAARRARPPVTGAADGAESRRVVEGESRRAHLRVQAASGAQIPQRRSRHKRRREIQLRPLQGSGRARAAGARAAGGDRRSADRSLPLEGALARLHDVLRNDGERGRARGAEEVRDARRRRRLPEAPDRRGPVPVREPPTRHRGRARGVSVVLAACPIRQAGGHEERPGGDGARCHAQEGRGRHRLLARR